MRSQLLVVLLVSGGAVLLLEKQIWSLKATVYKLQDSLTNPAAGKRSRQANPVENHPSHALVFYNRVPKTGSTTFMAIIYKLCYDLNYNVLHLNITKNELIMAPSDQYDFVHNISRWTEKLPGFYHGHVAFIDFPRFGFIQPIYIQIVREPLERLVSHYYFLRYGDDYRSHLIRVKMGDHTTFDECVEKKKFQCQPRRLWLQIPLFCGHEPMCWKPGNEWALKKAKQRLLSNYLVVGITDEITEFIAVLEAMVPQFFLGASKLYASSGVNSHMRKTLKKDQPSERTVQIMQNSTIYQMEREFYDFAKIVFEDMKGRTIYLKDGSWRPIAKRYHYEKIKP